MQSSIVPELYRRPKVGGWLSATALPKGFELGELKAWRHHADNLGHTTSQLEGFSQDRRIADKLTLPELIAEDHDRRLAEILVGPELTAQQRFHAQHGEEIRPCDSQCGRFGAISDHE